MGDDYYAATAPHSERGGYISFMAGDDQNQIKANYKGITTAWSNSRGSTIKTLFHLNQNIRPWD